MKKHLLKTLLTALVLLTGWGSSAWADTDIWTMDFSTVSTSSTTALTNFTTGDEYAKVGQSGWSYASYKASETGANFAWARLRSDSKTYGFCFRNKAVFCQNTSYAMTIIGMKKNYQITVNTSANGIASSFKGNLGGTWSESVSTDNKTFTYTMTEDGDLNLMVAAGAYVYSVKVVQLDEIATTSYTVRFVDGSGGTLKSSAEHTDQVVGNQANATSEEMAAFEKDGVYYILDTENTASTTIASLSSNATENIITLVFKQASLFSYLVKSSLGTTLGSGEAYESSTVTVPYPEFELSGTTLYKAGQGNSGYYRNDYTVNSALEETISYSSDKSDVVFYSEAEDIEGAVASTTGNADVRCSNATGAYFESDTKLTSLPAGKYTIFGQVWGGKDEVFTITVNGETVWTLTTTGSLTNSTSDEFVLLESTDLMISQSGSANKVLDLVYIQKTADITVAAPTFTPEATSEELDGDLSISLSCATEGASIYYTIDGTEPTAESTLYSETGITMNETTTIKAVAILGDVVSEVAEATYTFKFVPVDCTAKVPTNGWKSDQGNVGDYNKDVAQKEQYLTNTTTTNGNVLYQTVTGLDDGTYTVELYANASYTPGRGFASDALNGDLGRAIVYAGDVEKTIPVIHQTGVGENNIVTLENVVVSGNTLTMGLKKNLAGSNWHTIQIKSLTMTSDKAEANTAAQDTYWIGVATTIAGKEEYANVKGVERANLTGAETKADVQSAISVFYAALSAYNNLAQAIADAEALDVDVTDAQAVLDGVETTAADATDALHLVRLAVNTKAVEGASKENPIETNFVVNGTFDTNGVTAPWKTTTGAQNQTTANNQQGAFNGNFFENWNGSNYTGKIYQEIEDIPNGMYELSICAFVNTFDATAQYVYANADKTPLTTGTPTAYTVRTIVTNNKIEVGFEQTAAVNGWSGIDNVKLAYLGEVNLDELVATYDALKAQADELAESKMSSEALSALTAANVEVDKASADELTAAIDALTLAVQNASTSANAYTDAKAALDAMKAVMDGTNVYTAEAFDTYNGIYAANLEKYNAGTLTNDEAKAIVNPSIAIAWGDRSNAKYGDAATFLLSDWEVSFPDFGSGYYINTWSVEGDTDGSDFKVPFFEYFTGESNSLSEKTLTATVNDLENGQYKVTAWVRVETKTGVGATEADGITLAVNDGTGTDVTQGTQIGETRRSHATYEALCLVKDGVLTINFNVAAVNNVHWLSFKNVKYEKVRDLTEEEAGFDAAKSELADAIAAARDIDTTGKNGAEELAAAITAAETALNDAEATYASFKAATSALEEAIEAFEAANKPFSIDDYLVNADFSGTGGWTAYYNGNHDEGKGNIGTYGVRSDLPISATDETHLATEFCLGFNARWSGNYSSYKQETQKELPVGVYKLTFDVQNRNTGTNPVNYDNLCYVQVGDQKYTDSSNEWMKGSSGWTTHSITFAVTEASKAIVSFGYGTGSNNIAHTVTPALYVSHLSLESLELATEADYAQMDEAISDAEDKTMGFETGEFAPYKNVEPLNLLAAAKAIDKTAMNAKEDVLSLGNATWVANTEEVNAIYDGDFAIQSVPSSNTRPIGWQRHSATAKSSDGTDGGYETRLISLVSGVSVSGKGMMTKHHAFYGEQYGYELPLKANTYYTLTFKYCGYNDSPTMHINVYGEDGAKVANSEDFAAKDNKGHQSADSWSEYSYTFQTAEAGNYVIGIIKNIGGTQQNQGGFTDISLIKAPTTDVTLAVTDAQYATFVAPFDVTIPDGVTAYTVDAVIDNELTMTAVETTIVANTPVVLFSETVVEEEVSGVANPVETPTAGLLTGVYTDTPAIEGTYILQKQDAVAFFKVETAGITTVKANHAYLTAPASGARAYYFGGEATAIGALKALTGGDAEIYDVNGRKQVKLQKGVNIIRTKDGRTQKVMVK